MGRLLCSIPSDVTVGAGRDWAGSTGAAPSARNSATIDRYDVAIRESYVSCAGRAIHPHGSDRRMFHQVKRTPLVPRMIHPLRMPLQLRWIVVDRSQITGRIPLRFVVEMRRARMAALATCRDRDRSHAVAKLDYRHKAVAAGAVPLFGSRIRARTERSQRAPQRRREADRDAWLGVVELLLDVTVVALVAVDVAPRRLPRSKIRCELVGRSSESFQLLLRSRLIGRVLLR